MQKKETGEIQIALEESELRYRRLFEAAQDGILLLDFDTGIILDVNPFLINLLGYTKDDFLKKYLWEIVAFKDIIPSKENFAKLQLKEYIRYEDQPLETRGKNKISVEFVSNVYSVDNVKTIQCNIRDITDRKQLERELREAKKKEEAILASIGDGIMACDKMGNVTLFNAAAEELTGFSAKEVVGYHYRQCFKFVDEDDVQLSNDFIAEAIRSGKKTQLIKSAFLVKRNGHKISINDSTAPIEDLSGITVGCVLIFHDSSHERSVDKAKTEFVSFASHQLRTPLTAISWYTEMLLDEEMGKLNTEQKKYLSEVYKGSGRMIELINTLLNVTRLEFGTFPVEEQLVDVPVLLEEALGEFRPQIDEKKLKLSRKYADDLPHLNIDPKLLHIVVQNLLSNAVKYTPNEGSIETSLAIDALKKNMIITVSDTGCGIPKNQENKIFTKLFRADNVQGNGTQGTGLGLYVVKIIVDRSGGTIGFVSEENKGTTFSVTLPLFGAKK